jgi:hypothetical protein
MARAQLWLATDRPVVFLEGHMTAWKRDGLTVASGEDLELGDAVSPNSD